MRAAARWLSLLAGASLASCAVLAGIDRFTEASADAGAAGDTSAVHPPLDAVAESGVLAPDGNIAVDAPLDVFVPPPSCLGLAIYDANPFPIPAKECSMSSLRDAQLQIRSGCAEPVDILWVDFGCNEKSYGTLFTGESRTLQSFVTHAWRLRLSDGGPIIKQIPPLDSGVTTVEVP